MNKIKDLVNPINNEKYEAITAELESKWFNETIGDLDKEDGIDCPKCKNKGKISIIFDGYERIKDCECMKARNTYHRLENCGINKDTLKRFSFENWKTDYEWQKNILNICREYYKDYKAGNRNWFVASGQSGCGKTMICTCLFQQLIKSLYQNGIYMLWNSEIPRLLALRKSSYTDNQEKYEELVNVYKNTDVLYIDDLFKLDNRYRDESLSICYEILNHRYINNKTTIISTEIERNQLEQIDEAIWSRIVEMTNEGKYWITIKGKDKNYRV